MLVGVTVDSCSDDISDADDDEVVGGVGGRDAKARCTSSLAVYMGNDNVFLLLVALSLSVGKAFAS